MGLTGWLDRLAARRPHVLVVEAPGWWPARLALEAELGRRGGTVAGSPAEADALVVVGEVESELTEIVERLWQQLPGPRARADVLAAGDVPAALDKITEQLADRSAQTRDSAQRNGFQPGAGDDMSPSGIALASGADDRDGLEMDVLHLPLGPVLRHWPAGLVLRCTISGDVVTDVEVDRVGRVGRAPDAFGSALAPRLLAARCLDSASSVLSLAGSVDQHATARALRDRLVSDDGAVTSSEIARLHQRLSRSRTLRWMLRGVGHWDGSDVHGRLVSAVDDAAAYLDGREPPARASARHDLPDLLRGVELAQVRLVVASLSLDLEPVAAEGVHG